MNVWSLVLQRVDDTTAKRCALVCRSWRIAYWASRRSLRLAPFLWGKSKAGAAALRRLRGQQKLGASVTSVRHVARMLGRRCPALRSLDVYQVDPCLGPVLAEPPLCHRLQTLQLGDILLHDVEAGIVPGMAGEEVLLGMSALRQLDFRSQGGDLLLRQYQ